jgi:hypothetical protein
MPGVRLTQHGGPGTGRSSVVHHVSSPLDPVLPRVSRLPYRRPSRGGTVHRGVQRLRCARQNRAHVARSVACRDVPAEWQQARGASGLGVAPRTETTKRYGSSLRAYCQPCRRSPSLRLTITRPSAHQQIIVPLYGFRTQSNSVANRSAARSVRFPHCDSSLTWGAPATGLHPSSRLNS